jgi:hypothetical protein
MWCRHVVGQFGLLMNSNGMRFQSLGSLRSELYSLRWPLPRPGVGRWFMVPLEFAPHCLLLKETGRYRRFIGEGIHLESLLDTRSSDCIKNIQQKTGARISRNQGNECCSSLLLFCQIRKSLTASKFAASGRFRSGNDVPVPAATPAPAPLWRSNKNPSRTSGLERKCARASIRQRRERRRQ